MTTAKAKWWREFNDILQYSNFESFIASEDKAVNIDAFSCNFFPGLFQTENYAKAIINLIGAMPQTLKVRMLRQWHVLNKPAPPFIRLVISEAVLYKRVGGKDTLLEQLLHIKELASQPNILVYVLPLSAGGSKMSAEPENIFLHKLDSGRTHDIFYKENYRGMYRSTNEAEVVSYRVSFEKLVTECYSQEKSIQKIAEVADSLI